MNPLTQTAHSRKLSWPMAAGSLLVAAFAFTTGAEAQVPRAATLVPTQHSQQQAAMAQPAPSALVPAAAPVSQPGSYALESIGAGDMVRISVFRNPDLTTETRVTERGTVLFPLIGEISVAGLTPAQAGSAIAEKLRQGRFVVNPEVTLSMMQVNSRQVSVLGNVNKPGRYPLDGTSAKLTDLLAIAGGIAPTGSDQVTIVSTRGGKTTSIDVDIPTMLRNGDLTQNVSLEPGDTVFVHRAPMVYVYGEVHKGGAYRLENGMTVMQAIAMGGGITPRGTERGIKVTRKNGDGKSHSMNVGLTDPVQTDDVIYVRESLF
jgi:polysaccharide export outer membrane protein